MLLERVLIFQFLNSFLREEKGGREGGREGGWEGDRVEGERSCQVRLTTPSLSHPVG